MKRKIVNYKITLWLAQLACFARNSIEKNGIIFFAKKLEECYEV